MTHCEPERATCLTKINSIAKDMAIVEEEEDYYYELEIM